MQDHRSSSTWDDRAPKGLARSCFHPQNVPFVLRDLVRWVCWSYVWSPAKKKWDKPPRRVNGTWASSTDPATWCEFDHAVRAVRVSMPSFDGIGLALVGDGLTAIDLDRCLPFACADAVRAGDLAGVEEWAREVVTDLNSYTELSPSACGIRILVRATLPGGHGNRKERFEAYDRARYVTVTGDHVAGMPKRIEERQRALEYVVARMLPPIVCAPLSEKKLTPLPDDDALLEKARGAKNGARFVALFERGELAAFGGDHSRADLALCSMLAFWCGSDVARVDRLFRRSALYREKWDERHRRSGETYGQMTIARALYSRCGSLHLR